jgi:transposase
VDRLIKTEIDWSTIEYIGELAMDEIAVKKGYKDYITIVSCRVDGEITVLATLKGRKKSIVKAFLKSIPKRLKKTVEAICVDMYIGYINAAKEVFKNSALIVIDRFHVAKLYRGELDKYRQKTLRELKQTLSKTEYEKITGATQILRKTNECLTQKEKDIIDELFSLSPNLMEAYRITIKLTHVFNTHQSKDEALVKFKEWINLVRKSKLTFFNKFIKTFRKFQNEIANYFIARNTSGFAEGLNNKIKVLKRRCYGIFNVKSLFQRLHLDVSGYRILLGRS